MAITLDSHVNAPISAGHTRHWEEAGTMLERAITTYLHSSQTFERTTPTLITDAPNLHERLDYQIEHVHVSMMQLLTESFASVARARNRLVPPINRIPTEILGQIFQLALSSAGNNQPMGSAMEATYRSLYNILGVCSIWKKVGLAHKPLWALVPIIDQRKPTRFRTEKAVNISLERAGESELHLAADILAVDLRQRVPVLNRLAELRSRLRSINLRASSRAVIEHILGPLIQGLSPGSLKELSLNMHPPMSSSPMTHEDDSCFQGSQPTFWASFEQLLGSLRVLRLRRVVPRMVNISFSSLVELRIQAFAFRHDTALRELLWSVATASQLRKLELITITIYNVQNVPTPPEYKIPFPLPNLQMLFLEDLREHVLQTVFFAIKSGAHRTVLSLSPLYKLAPDVADLNPAIKSQTIDTLVLRGFRSWDTPDWITPISSVFNVIPSPRAICLDRVHLGRESLVGLTRRLDLTDSPTSFPNFHRLYISRSTIDYIGDLAGFKSMLASHPLEEVVLGGHFNVDPSGSLEPYYSDSDDDERWQVEIARPDERTIPIKS
ncbi:unnamed protein product [Rhizoctonia solani]|uniref:F-box domain-containing protein n=1 Tax=Rhizoctonia solani TaxID=456999 RepID=A0A8H2XUV0_9AGAM|nr:unnamed protein product [Rhizoctonia solani]CAE6501367.1 unnamed protein product [Rhizoctonia solani]